MKKTKGKYVKSECEDIGKKEKFIHKAKIIHKNRYDYSKMIYKLSNSKVEIICPDHESFFQVASSHLQGHGCPQCRNLKMRKLFSKGTNVFVKQSKNVHKNLYFYDKTDYVNSETLVEIICRKHGSFFQRPHDHLRKNGCPKCADELNSKKQSLTNEEFINRAIKIHGDKYDYSKTDYILNKKE